jgi:hypothetical protein
MNENLSKQLIPLEINVDQWRRDVKTFAETTIQALDAIVSQLSNSCSSSSSGDEWNHANYRERENPEARTNFATSDARNDDRLAKIKSQLAKRLSNSNQH